MDTEQSPILRTKLYRPPIPVDHVLRHQLLERLDQAPHQPFVLVSAPAGYGKSTLVSCWLERCGRPSAWLSLDKDDNDLSQFISCFVAAVQTIFPEWGCAILALIDVPTLPPTPVLAATLVNEMDKIDQNFIVVLDDIHLILEKSVHDFLDIIIRHPSRSMQLVLIGRRDPILSIAPLRAKGLLTEVRLQDLRFTTDETLDFFKRSMEGKIEKSTAIALAQNSEGWVTGLRLAVIAMRWQDNASQKLLELKGTTHYVLNYLVTEVLDLQPAGIRHLLLHTSILDRFCAPLCDALSEKSEPSANNEVGGHEFINWLLKDNLFVIPLDTENRWFRYHHLFHDLLNRQLQQNTNAEKIATLHVRASEWLEARGLITESLEHALAAGDAMRTAKIVEANRDKEFFADRWFVVARWLAMLPDEIKWERPKLLLTEAWIKNLQHQMERVPRLLDKAESLLCSQTAEPSLAGEIAFFRGYIAYWDGQGERCRQYNEEAVSKLSGKKNPFLGEAELMLGVARCMTGQTEQAVRALEHRINEVESSEGQLISRLIAGLAFIHLICGDLPRALAEAQLLQLTAKKFSKRLTNAWSSYMLACSHLHAGEFEAASHHFAQSYEQRYVLEPMAALDALAGLALTQQLMGMEDEAMETAGRLETFAQELNEPQYLSMVPSCYARISLLRGDLDSALKQARMISDQPAPANLFMWLESPPITRARVLIAADTKEGLVEAIELLRSIRELSEACRFTCQTIEVMVLQSLALERQGHAEEALEALEEALALANSRGWIRPFVEAGPPMADLLNRLCKQCVDIDYIQRILAVFGDDDRVNAQHVGTHSISPSLPPLRASTSAQTLLEPLTNRELDILDLLAERWRNKEIAEKLFISPATVKSHLRNLYRKLQVEKRREAVKKAIELGILR